MDEEDKEKLLSGFVTQDGCWIWTRGCAVGGYGSVAIGGKTRRAHRACYELIYEVTLTPEQFLHHLCKNKACINPFHLEVTTQANHVDSATYGNKEKPIVLMAMSILPRILGGAKEAKAENVTSASYHA